MKAGSPRFVFASIAVIAVLAISFWWFNRNQPAFDESVPRVELVVAPETTKGDAETNAAPRTVSMDEVLELAKDALLKLRAEVNDYTAMLTKQEVDTAGKLQPVSEMFLKVRTEHQNGTDGHPLCVYLKFNSPESTRGREVIWIENANDGKLLVREAGFVGSMMTAKIEPTGFLAMQGQRYPISEIGLTNLLEQLIQRGEPDRSDPGVRVVMDERHETDEGIRTLIQITRKEASGRANDFSFAEVVVDRDRNLITQFRSYGWPNQPGEEPPLIESYAYRDIQLNVGLTDKDFDPANESYTFVE